MESFPDRTHVWLGIREYGGYLYADEDREGISISDTRGELHGAWAVHRLVRGDAEYVLFRSASYGRYLALIEDDEVDEDGVPYYFPVQCTYDFPEQVNVLFQARLAEDGSGDIFIRSFRFDDWCNAETNDSPMHWEVQAIPERLLPPELPDPPHPILPPAVSVGGPIRRGHHRCRAILAVQPQAELRRTIHYVREDDQGNFNQPQWRILHPFLGRSVFNLRRDLAAELGEADNVEGITLCAWAGSNGRLTPLVIDLPPDERTMNIVVLTTGSPAYQELVYPNVDAP